MKLITEEVQKVKFVTEGKGSNKKLYIEVFSYKEISRIEMVECILSKLSKEKLADTTNLLFKRKSIG